LNKKEKKLGHYRNRLINILALGNLLSHSFLFFAFYVIFHGHRLGVDCWLCRWRGII